jgi:type IV pilus assembly protein PilF
MMKIFTLSLVFLSTLMATPILAQVVVVPESTHNSQDSTDIRKRARLHAELASLYFQNGNLSVALEETGVAIEADPSYASAYSVRALVYSALREFDAAEADFRKSLSLAPSDPDVNNNYGWYLCQRDRARDSIPYFLVAIKNPLYSTPDVAYANAGACALKAGDRESARSYLSQALRMGQSGAPLAQLQLAKLAYLENHLEEARNRLMDVMQMLQPSAEALWLGARIERKMGHKEDEASMVSQLRRLYPTSQEYQEFLKGNYD